MTTTSPARWEYLTVPQAERNRLDALGVDGWELVAVDGAPKEPMLYLKRPAMDFRERVTLEQRRRYYESLGHDPDAPPRGQPT